MSKKIKDTDYLFISAFLRARESKLLSKDKIERMIDAKSAEEAAKILEECGYEGIVGCSISALDAKLSKKRADIMNELAFLVPNKALVDVFRLKYDYHNAKVLIKSEPSAAEPSKLMSHSGRIPADELADAFRKDSFDQVPETLALSMRDAKDTLARTGDPQLADFILDKAYFSEFSKYAETTGSKFLAEYCRLLVDSANLRTMVRALRMGKGSAFLHSVLFEGGNITPDKLIAETIAKKTLAEIFASSPLAAAAEVGDRAASGSSGLTEFEKLCDDTLTVYLKKARTVSFGNQVLIGYLGAIENESLAARIVMTGKIAGLAPQVIRERLRDSYV